MGEREKPRRPKSLKISDKFKAEPQKKTREKCKTRVDIKDLLG
jgi:hypothetical protein